MQRHLLHPHQHSSMNARSLYTGITIESFIDLSGTGLPETALVCALPLIRLGPCVSGKFANATDKGQNLSSQRPCGQAPVV